MIKDTQVDFLRESMDVFDDRGNVIRYEEILMYDREEKVRKEGWYWKTFNFKTVRWIDDKSYYLLHKDPHWNICYCAARMVFDIERIERSWAMGNDKRIKYVVTYEQYRENPFIMDIILREIDRRAYM